MRTWIIAIVAGVAIATATSHASDAWADDMETSNFEQMIDEAAVLGCDIWMVHYTMSDGSSERLRAVAEIDRRATAMSNKWGVETYKSAVRIAIAELKECKRTCANGFDHRSVLINPC